MSSGTLSTGVSRQADFQVNVQGYDETCNHCKSKIEAGSYYLPPKFNKELIRCYTCPGFTVIKVHRVPKPLTNKKYLQALRNELSLPVSPRTRAANVPESSSKEQPQVTKSPASPRTWAATVPESQSKEQPQITKSPASPRIWAEHFPTSPSEENTEVTTEPPINESLDYFRWMIWECTEYDTIQNFTEALNKMTVERPSLHGPSKIVPVRNSGPFIIHRIVLPIIHLKNFKGRDWQYNIETKKVTTTWIFSERHIRGGKQVRSQASSPKSDSSHSSFGESQSQFKILQREIYRITKMTLGSFMSHFNRLPELPKRYDGGPPKDGKFKIEFTRDELIYLTDNRGCYWQYNHLSNDKKASRVTQPVSPRSDSSNSPRLSSSSTPVNGLSPKPLTNHSPKPVNENSSRPSPVQSRHFTQRSQYWDQSNTNSSTKTKSTQFVSKKQMKVAKQLDVVAAVDKVSGNDHWGE
jgi:hypothetical protein